MYLAREWERFYAHSKTGDNDLVDLIEIDGNQKKFVLFLDINYLATDGCDETGEEYDSYYVSRFIFDMIVSGLRAKGFTELIAKKIKHGGKEL